jgi:hypothetical protein
MTKPALKIGPLPDRTPVKLSLLIDPSLRAELEAYASVYAQTYGDTPGIEALVPAMLETFLASDGAFRRAQSLARRETARG